MEIVWVIGILAAFVLGAWVRKPFYRPKKEAEPETLPEPDELKQKRESYMRQWENMMNYGMPGYSQKDVEE